MDMFVKKQQQQVFETLKGLLHCLPLLSGVDSNSCHFLLFLRYKKGGIKIQTKHKYTYRTNTKQKLAFSCNIFRLFALLLTKTCLRSHGYVHDCDHLLDGDAHDILQTPFLNFQMDLTNHK